MVGAEEVEPPFPGKRRRHGWALVTGAALLCWWEFPLSLPPGTKPSDTVTWLWGERLSLRRSRGWWAALPALPPAVS